MVESYFAHKKKQQINVLSQWLNTPSPVNAGLETKSNRFCLIVCLLSYIKKVNVYFKKRKNVLHVEIRKMIIIKKCLVLLLFRLSHAYMEFSLFSIHYPGSSFFILDITNPEVLYHYVSLKCLFNDENVM